MFNTIAHSATLYYHYYVIKYISTINFGTYDDEAILQFKANRTKYYTMWCFGIQALLFLCCLVHDVTRLFNESNPLRRAACWIKDVVFVSLAMPLAFMVSSSFWALYFLDRNLVMPEVVDKVVPSWLNHALHTNIAVLVLVELLAERQRVPSKKVCFTVLGIYEVVYMYQFFAHYFETGNWLYPVFHVLDWPGKIIFTVFLVINCFILMVLSRKLVHRTWGVEMTSKKQHRH